MDRTVMVLSAALALAPVAALAQAGPFLQAEGPDLWRASKLVGVDVLGPDGRKIGDVRDVLMDHDGRAADVVIGVGGFLGIGEKDVALPFAQVHFADAPRPGASGSPAGTPAAEGRTPPASATAAVGGPVGTTTGVPGGQAAGLSSTPAAPPGGTAAPAHSTTRPDHATIDMTAEQLKNAPAFSFAP